MFFGLLFGGSDFLKNKSKINVEEYIKRTNVILENLTVSSNELIYYAQDYVSTRSNIETAVSSYLDNAQTNLDLVKTYQSDAQNAYTVAKTNLSDLQTDNDILSLNVTIVI